MGASQALAKVLSQPGLKSIVKLSQNPCGKIATAFKPYPASPEAVDQSAEAVTEVVAEAAEEFPLCRHGGWQECGMQAEALCVANMTGDPFAMAALVDCHFSKGSSAGAATTSPTLGSDCAAQLGFDYQKIFTCAFEGQYPAPYGKGLLAAAFNRQISRKIMTVPTMFLNGEETMAWSDPSKLLGAICAAYQGPSPPAGCSQGNIEHISAQHTAAHLGQFGDAPRCLI